MKSKNNTLVSVIMPAYNAEIYLAGAIKSILDQTFKDFELILIDDGSEDKTLEIAKRYAQRDKRIKIIKNKNNQGIIKTLNTGLKIAKGKYIVRMDSDDLSFPKRLEMQFNFLEKNKEIFLVATSYETIDEKDKLLGECIYNFNPKKIERALINHGVINHPTVMFRNSGKYFYRDKALHCEDKDLWLRMISDGKKLIVLPTILLKYRIHSNSISIRSNVLQNKMLSQVKRWHLQRKLIGKDSYDTFDAKGFVEHYNPVSPEFYLKIKRLKNLFKTNLSGREFRTDYKQIFGKSLIKTWPVGLVLYPLSFFNLNVRKKISKIIWKH